MAIEVTTFESKSALLAEMEALMRSALVESREQRFAVVISGGNTPLPVYQALAADPVAASPTACIAFADDRYVPVDSPESNFGNARAMIEAVGVSAENTLRIHPELELEEAADRYNGDWAEFFDGGGTIPLAFLGLGADGHTCSLFNDGDLERCAGRWAAAVYKDTPPHRVTVSPQLLARVERVVFVAAGDDKLEMITALLEAPTTITAGKAIADCPSVALWRA